MYRQHKYAIQQENINENRREFYYFNIGVLVWKLVTIHKSNNKREFLHKVQGKREIFFDPGELDNYTVRKLAHL